MKQYNLGPNGGIMTSLNLFATRFDQACAAATADAPTAVLCPRWDEHECALSLLPRTMRRRIQTDRAAR